MRNAFLLAALSVIALRAAADFKVMESADTLALKDGGKLEGIIVASGTKAMVIVVATEEGAKEMLVPRERIREVTIGEPSTHTKAYMTDPVDGVKMVTGEGFRDSGAPAVSEPKPKPAEQPKPQPVVKRKPAGAPAGTPVPPKITADMIKSMMEKDARLKVLVNAIGGPEKAAEFVNDPNKRRELEELAKSLKMELPRTF